MMLLLYKMEKYGVGRRGFGDALFTKDPPLPRYGIYDLDEEDLCHKVVETSCHIPGCDFTSESLLGFENHYNASHRYACSQCKKILPSPHLLDLHIQESHDSFFAVMSAKKPSFCCYIEECKEKFMTAEQRIEHCIKVHRLPKDYRFEQLQATHKGKIQKQDAEGSTMEVDAPSHSQQKSKKFSFTNSKQKGFINSQYSGKKFTHDKKEGKDNSVNIDKIVGEIKDSFN